MSSRIFRMWPALALALLLAAVWHWGAPAELVRADHPSGAGSPYLHFDADSLLDGAVAAGDFLTVDVGGFAATGHGAGADRVWLYRWSSSVPNEIFPGCSSVARDEFLLVDGVLDDSGGASFLIRVTVPPFQEGDGNTLCVLRVGGESVSRTLQVDVLPDVYLMEIGLDSIAAAGTDSSDDLLENNALKADFEVSGGRGLTEWGTATSGFSQVRGVDGGSDGVGGEEALLTVSGEWRACPKRGTLEVGCEWDDLDETDAAMGGRYSGSEVHLVPGDEMELRISLPTTSAGDLNLAAEKFVVFWGPVDVWLLGTEHGSNGVEAADYVVHDEHLRPLDSELNSRIVQLSPGKSVDLPISRSSANRQGHTFVSMVPCNDGYLKRLFGDDAITGELKERLEGLEDCTVQQGPAFEDYGTNMPPGTDETDYIMARELWLRDAWLQNDVLSGRELYCEIVPTIYRDWDDENSGWQDSWSMEIFCENPDAPWSDLRAVSNDISDTYSSDSDPLGCYEALVRPYYWDAYDVAPSVAPERPVPARPPSAGPPEDPGHPGSPAVSGVKELQAGRYRCGWSPAQFKTAKWPVPLGYTNPWYTTRYNAAGSFYSFAVEWKLGGDLGSHGDECSAMLLPYRPLRGGGVRAVFPDTSRWRVGRVPSSACEAEAGVDSVDLLLKSPTPPPPTGRTYRSRLAYGEKWGRYPDHSMHFAVYLSGMPSALDYRLEDDSGETGGTGGSADWRLVSLGSWVYDEDGNLRSGSYGGRFLLGVAHPVGSGTTAASGGFDSVPTVSDLYDGLPVTVTRDFANDAGEVDVYVVPCRPLQSGAVPVVDEVQGACEHLPAGRGHVRAVTFERGANSSGPFGLVEPSASDAGYKLQYSIKFTVRFRGSAWYDNVERRVSLPVEEGVPAGDECAVSSAVEAGSLYWPERLVSGGACDRNTLDVARVVFRNDGLHEISGVDSPSNGGRLDRLVVYVTGGRSDALDLIQVKRAGFTYDDATSLGRLGVRERSLALDYGSSHDFYISPDLADESGDVWLLAYSCGARDGEPRFLGAWGHCPWVGGSADLYDVPIPPSFVVRVRFTAESGLAHADLGPVCQGDDCAPRVPVLREALPDGGLISCEVSSYPAGVAGLVYWPDRLVQGGACAPPGLSPVSVSIKNGSAVGGQKLVVYATGGRTPGLEEVQVRRGGGANDDGEPSGKAGLREVQMSLDAGGSGSVLVDPDLADEEGKVWLLAYLCSGPGGDCPVATVPGNASLYSVDRRPLFQVLVQYDAGLLAFSSLAICRGDSCAESYPLGRLSAPDGPGCAVEAQYDQERLYWPDALVTGGDCERRDLSDVPVSFVLPAGASNESLTVYVTGGRSRGLEEVSVLRAADQPASAADAAYIGHLVDEPVLSLVDAGSTVPAVVASKSWVTDGLTEREEEAISWLRTLGSNVDRVGRMRFLNDFDELDYLTLRALSRANRLGVISDILGHTALSSGIGNADRVKVIGVSTMVHGDTATSGAVANIRSRLVSSSEYGAPPVIREGFSVVVSTASGNRRDDVANEVLDSLLEIKRLMDRDFPTDHVLLFLDEASVPPSPSDRFRIKGVNFGYAMSYLPDLSTAELSSGIAHEVSHYYWRGADQTWLHEGVASAFEVLVGGDEPRKKSEGCTNLRKLVEANPGRDSALDICNYYLGQRLFLDLHRSLGDDGFYAGLQRLYNKVEACQGPPRADSCGTIDDVRAAFPASLAVIDQHWGLSDDVGPSGPADASGPLGRLGLRERQLTLSAAQTAQVLVSPDLADQDGNVWLFAYRCVGVHGDRGCPLVSRPVFNGYDLPVGPTFAVRVRFTPEPVAADLKEVCRGQQCDIAHPWLRRAEPDVGECGARLGTYWPDRVIRGGDCYVRGSNYGSVVFEADAAEKFVVYTTGDGRRELDLVQVYGVLRDGSDAAVDDSGEPLGRHGLRESLIELAAGGEERTWVRADMADDDGNVWLLAYRCEADHGDASCPLVDRDQVRPSYDVEERPTFVVRVNFVPATDANRSTLEADCSSSPGTCALTATFRDVEGTTLPGTVEFRVDRGALGEAGSTAQVSQQRHQEDAAGNRRFKETLILPTDGGMVNVEAELLGDGTVLTRRVGRARNVARLSAEVMRCSGDAQSCHAGGLTKAENLLAGDHFVLAVTGYDASGDVALPATKLGEAECRAGRPGSWPTFRLNSDSPRSYGYGTSQPADRGYAGCAIRVSDDAPVGAHGITVSYRAGSGAPVTVQVQVVVGVDTTKLGYLVLSGPSQIESGESGTYRVVGLNLERLQMGYDLEGGCVKLNLSGALEGGEGGSPSGSDGCLSDGLPKSGVEFTVQAKEDVVYQTDSSIGVSYGDISVRNHVLVVPADDRGGGAVPSTSSHISNLTISQEGGQLSVTWNGSPQADSESLRAQVWVVVGGEDVFLPGCEGGEVHDVNTQQVFCLLSYGQSGDVYHAAVGFIRYDNSAVPVETAQWTRP